MSRRPVWTVGCASAALADLVLWGLATDFCVAWSAEDAARLGYQVTIVEDACRAIALPTTDGRTTLDEARARLSAFGVRFINSKMLAG